MTLTEIIKEVQSTLKLEADGVAGPKTWGAIHQRIVGGKSAASAAKAPTPELGTVDTRSETTIATLLPEIRPYARALVQRAASAGITIKIISGLRTYEEQEALYAKGRTKPATRSRMPPQATPTTTLASLSTSACLKAAPTKASRPNTKPSARWASISGWNGEETGNRSLMSLTTSSARPGRQA
jgi:hypothetical protein